MLLGQPKRSLTVSRQVTKPVSLPAPQGGVNRVDGLAAMPPQDAIFLYNMLPSEYGTRVREGYQAWATGVGNGWVRTIIPFTGDPDPKLFACAADGIYDISNSVASPSAAFTFATENATSGLGVWSNFVNDAAAYFVLYTDETNGYHVYTAATDTWAAVAMGGGATEVSNVDPADLVFVTLFKNRVWFVERGTANAWYLPAGTIYGAATKFNFGNKFKHGGYLVALYSWTVDGGEGVDDYLVAISSGGDVVVYKGSDPATATDWFQHGGWFIGPPPIGRRVAGSFSGELYLLSTYGIIPMSKLLSGTLVQLQEVQLSRKISPIINTEMVATRNSYGWEIVLVPSQNILLTSSPKREGFDYTQFAYSLNTPGWGVFRDLPYFTGASWESDFFFSDEDGNVHKYTGNQDAVDIDGENGVDINWAGLMSFQGFGNDGTYKRIQFIRPVFLAESAPSFTVEARYDYDLSEVFGTPSTSSIAAALWDFGIWDLSTWVGDFAVSDQVRGGADLGRVVSVGFEGNSSSATILIKFDLMLDDGGLL